MKIINSVNYAVRKSVRAKTFIVHANRLRPFYSAVDQEKLQSAEQQTNSLPTGSQHGLVPAAAADTTVGNSKPAAEIVDTAV